MNFSYVRGAATALACLGLLAAPGACKDQSEGQPCGVVTTGGTSDFSQYNAQCGTGLACIGKNVGGKVRGVCCPASGTSTEEVCGSTTQTTLEAGALDSSPPALDSGVDTGTDSGVSDSGVDGAAPDAGTDAN